MASQRGRRGRGRPPYSVGRSPSRGLHRPPLPPLGRGATPWGNAAKARYEATLARLTSQGRVSRAGGVPPGRMGLIPGRPPLIRGHGRGRRGRRGAQ